MSASGHSESSAEVEHEAEDTRAQLASTLDQLRENLKPENVVDEVLTNAKVGASSLFDTFWDSARRNPVPALLIGAGLAMMMGFGVRSRFKGAPKRPRPSGRGPEHWSPTTGETPSATATRLSSTRLSQEDHAMRQGSSPLSGLTNAFRDQPLLIGVIGVAVGAAIGAALPISETEEEWLGETSHALKRSAQAAAEAEVSEVKAAAARAVDDVKQAATERGVSKDNLEGLVHDVGEKARNALHDTAKS